jgi:ribulose-5-phosphate 4-epimerase/fuculose-1-phosphate aldolase
MGNRERERNGAGDIRGYHDREYRCGGMRRAVTAIVACWRYPRWCWLSFTRAAVPPSPGMLESPYPRGLPRIRRRQLMKAETLREILTRRKQRRELISDAEWEARVELAASYRLIAHYRMTDMIYNHISLRVPGTEDQFLINAFGLLYEEVTASNLVKVDRDGQLIDDDGLDVNPAGFVIHSAIHMARPDVHCVLHTHTRAGVAVSVMKRGLLPVSQHAMRFYNRVGYHDYEGIALDTDERSRLVADLGNHHTLILRNHGLLTTGASVHAAFELMYYLEMACQIQSSLAGDIDDWLLPASAACEKAALQFEQSHEFLQQRDWHALIRLVERIDPSYRE